MAKQLPPPPVFDDTTSAAAAPVARTLPPPPIFDDAPSSPQQAFADAVKQSNDRISQMRTVYDEESNRTGTPQDVQEAVTQGFTGPAKVVLEPVQQGAKTIGRGAGELLKPVLGLKQVATMMPSANRTSTLQQIANDVPKNVARGAADVATGALGVGIGLMPQMMAVTGASAIAHPVIQESVQRAGGTQQTADLLGKVFDYALAAKTFGYPVVRGMAAGELAGAMAKAGVNTVDDWAKLNDADKQRIVDLAHNIGFFTGSITEPTRAEKWVGEKAKNAWTYINPIKPEDAGFNFNFPGSRTGPGGSALNDMAELPAKGETSPERATVINPITVNPAGQADVSGTFTNAQRQEASMAAVDLPNVESRLGYINERISFLSAQRKNSDSVQRAEIKKEVDGLIAERQTLTEKADAYRAIINEVGQNIAPRERFLLAERSQVPTQISPDQHLAGTNVPDGVNFSIAPPEQLSAGQRHNAILSPEMGAGVSRNQPRVTPNVFYPNGKINITELAKVLRESERSNTLNYDMAQLIQEADRRGLQMDFAAAMEEAGRINARNPEGPEGGVDKGPSPQLPPSTPERPVEPMVFNIDQRRADVIQSKLDRGLSLNAQEIAERIEFEKAGVKFTEGRKPEVKPIEQSTPKQPEAPDMNRKELPQAEPEELKAKLQSRNVPFTEESVQANLLNPVQKRVGRSKVDEIKTSVSSGQPLKPIVVSKDGYIIDGHHRWAAARELGIDVKVLRLSANRDKAIEWVKKLESEPVPSKPEPKVSVAPAGVEQVRAFLKKMTKGEPGEHLELMRLAGDSNAAIRQNILHLLTGTKPPKAKAGITRVEEEIRKAAGITGGSLNEQGIRIAAWAKGEAMPQEAPKPEVDPEMVALDKIAQKRYREDYDALDDTQREEVDALRRDQLADIADKPARAERKKEFVALVEKAKAAGIKSFDIKPGDEVILDNGRIGHVKDILEKGSKNDPSNLQELIQVIHPNGSSIWIGQYKSRDLAKDVPSIVPTGNKVPPESVVDPRDAEIASVPDIWSIPAAERTRDNFYRAAQEQFIKEQGLTNDQVFPKSTQLERFKTPEGRAQFQKEFEDWIDQKTGKQESKPAPKAETTPKKKANRGGRPGKYSQVSEEDYPIIYNLGRVIKPAWRLSNGRVVMEEEYEPLRYFLDLSNKPTAQQLAGRLGSKIEGNLDQVASEFAGDTTMSMYEDAESFRQALMKEIDKFNRYGYISKQQIESIADDLVKNIDAEDGAAYEALAEMPASVRRRVMSIVEEKTKGLLNGEERKVFENSQELADIENIGDAIESAGTPAEVEALLRELDEIEGRLSLEGEPMGGIDAVSSPEKAFSDRIASAGRSDLAAIADEIQKSELPAESKDLLLEEVSQRNQGISERAPQVDASGRGNQFNMFKGTGDAGYQAKMPGGSGPKSQNKGTEGSPLFEANKKANDDQNSLFAWVLPATYTAIDALDVNDERKKLLKSLLMLGMGGAMIVKAPIWYLKSKKALLESKQSIFTAAQARALFKGVKAEEMKWTGLDDFLKAKGDGKITREELQSVLDQDNIRIEEKMHGGNGIEEQWAHYDLTTIVEENKNFGFADTEMVVNGIIDGSFDVNAFDIPEKLRIKIHDLANAVNGNPRTKYDQYVQPGGKNYRELLLTLPVTSNVRVPFEQWAEAKYGSDWKEMLSSSDTMLSTMKQQYETAQRSAEWSGYEDITGRKDVYKSGHWNEPNVLAHVRFNDRVIDGKRTLFLEETQSDWHREGRKKGYSNGEQYPADYIDKHRKNLIEWRKKNGDNEIPSDQEVIDFFELSPIDRVPDAPFKGDWHEVVFRRMVRYAAENGYDAIAWTPGKLQQDRYDLSKQVENIRVAPIPETIAEGGRYVDLSTTDGMVHFDVDKNGKVTGQSGNKNFGSVVGKDLSDIVGKDVAKKVMETNDDTVLSGEDLRIGGEWATNLYDKALVSYANKFGKKFGAGVVTQQTDPLVLSWKPRDAGNGVTEYSTKVGYSENAIQILKFTERGKTQYHALSLIFPRPGGRTFDTFEDAEQYVKDNYLDQAKKQYGGNNFDAHTMPITPEMRKSANEEGMPLFSLIGGALFLANQLNADEDTKKKLDFVFGTMLLGGLGMALGSMKGRNSIKAVTDAAEEAMNLYRQGKLQKDEVAAYIRAKTGKGFASEDARAGAQAAKNIEDALRNDENPTQEVRAKIEAGIRERMVSKDLRPDMQEALRKISMAHRAANIPGQNRLWLMDKIAGMRRQYGAAGAEQQIRLLAGDIERRDILGFGNERLNHVKEIYGDMNVYERDAINRSVVDALQNRKNADKYLDTPQKQEVYKNIVAIFDYFKGLLKEKGYKVIEDDYFTHIAQRDIVDQILTGEEIKDLDKPLDQFISEKSPFLKPRFDVEFEIMRDLPKVMTTYMRSVSKEIAYKDAVEYYRGDFRRDIPADFRSRSMDLAFSNMKNSLNPRFSQGIPMRIADYLRSNQYTNYLSFGIKQSLQNYTQRILVDLYVTPATREVYNKLFPIKPDISGTKLEEVMSAAEKITPRQRKDLIQLSDELEAEKTTSFQDKFREKDWFNKAELGNWHSASIKSVLNGVVNDPAWGSTLQKNGGDLLKTVNELLSNPEIAKRAIREADVISMKTQVSPLPASRAPINDVPVLRIFTSMKNFKMRYIQVLVEALKPNGGIEGFRAQKLLERGMSGQVVPVEVLRVVETSRKALEAEIKRADDAKHEWALANGERIPKQLAQDYLNFLRSQEKELNDVIGEMEPSKRSDRLKTLARYHAALFVISTFTTMLSNILDQAVYNATNGRIGSARDEEDQIDYAMQSAIMDQSPMPFYQFYFPQLFVPVIFPSIKNMQVSAGVNKGIPTARAIAKDMVPYALNAVIPYGGLIDRATGRNLSRKIVDTITPKKEKPASNSLEMLSMPPVPGMPQ